VSQRGHIVKPTGSRKTWAIMYRDGDGNLRWEGKFHDRTDAQADYPNTDRAATVGKCVIDR